MKHFFWIIQLSNTFITVLIKKRKKLRAICIVCSLIQLVDMKDYKV